jgi:hypothetical protein
LADTDRHHEAVKVGRTRVIACCERRIGIVGGGRRRARSCWRIVARGESRERIIRNGRSTAARDYLKRLRLRHGQCFV